MKFFVAIALIAAVASGAVIKPTIVSEEMVQIQEVITAIQSPSTDPATAAALEAMLQDLLGIKPEPVIVGPAIVDTDFSPIAVGPEIIDFPVPDGGAVTAPEAVVVPSPVVIGELEAGQVSPLVQVIINVNQASTGPAPAPADSAIIDAPQPIIVVDEAVDPVIVVEAPVVEPIIPEPVQVAEPIIPEPVQVAEPIIPEPVQVAEPIIPEPVQVAVPVIVEPVVIGTPIIPAPAIVLPEELN